MRTVADYTALITSEHIDKPAFAATIAVSLTPYASGQLFLSTITDAYDLDLAIGAQLDIVGQWVGITRNITIPLTGVYFSWDTDSLGWEAGVWQGPFDSSEGLVVLADDAYRTLIRAKIAANSWNGTSSDIFRALGLILANSPGLLFVQDFQDMTMMIGLSGQLPDPITLALLSPKYIHLVPAGVRCSFEQASISGTPIFGFDVENDYISGWDIGSWAIPAGSLTATPVLYIADAVLVGF